MSLSVDVLLAYLHSILICYFASLRFKSICNLFYFRSLLPLVALAQALSLISPDTKAVCTPERHNPCVTFTCHALQETKT